MFLRRKRCNIVCAILFRPMSFISTADTWRQNFEKTVIRKTCRSQTSPKWFSTGRSLLQVCMRAMTTTCSDHPSLMSFISTADTWRQNFELMGLKFCSAKPGWVVLVFVSENPTPYHNYALLRLPCIFEVVKDNELRTLADFQQFANKEAQEGRVALAEYYTRNGSKVETMIQNAWAVLRSAEGSAEPSRTDMCVMDMFSLHCCG